MTKTASNVVNIKPTTKSRKRGPTKAELEAELAVMREEKAMREANTPALVIATAACIPALAAMLGWVAAEVAAVGNWLALLPGMMTAAVLTVSLPHVAKGLRKRLSIESREAWSLAIALDLAMVTCEAVLHFGGAGSSANWVCWGVMLMGLVGSTVFNVAGFRKGE